MTAVKSMGILSLNVSRVSLWDLKSLIRIIGFTFPAVYEHKMTCLFTDAQKKIRQIKKTYNV